MQSIDIDIPVELCDDIAHTDTGAQVFVLALEAAQVDDGSPLALEGSARYMWRQLTAGPTSVAELAARAAGRYGAAVEDVMPDVQRFVGSLVGRGVLRPARAT